MVVPWAKLLDFLWGGGNQLVLFAAGPTVSFLPIWLRLTSVSSTHTHTHLDRFCSHLSSNTHLLLNQQPFIQTHLSHTCINCGASCRLHAKRSMLTTMHLSVSVFTSIYDGATVVEDYSALVESRNCVEEVEGPQIPLKIQLRTISLILICRS